VWERRHVDQGERPICFVTAALTERVFLSLGTSVSEKSGTTFLFNARCVPIPGQLPITVCYVKIARQTARLAPNGAVGSILCKIAEPRFSLKVLAFDNSPETSRTNSQQNPVSSIFKNISL
jgi:hypothetical protein